MSEVRTDPEVPVVSEPSPAVVLPKPRLHTHHVNTLQSLAITIVIAVFVVTFIVQAFQIPSESMERTLLIGDYLLVDKAHYGHSRFWEWLLPYRPVQHLDIIVFRYPVNPQQHFVKRVIGIPGDHIRLINKHVYVNGEPQPDSYAEFNWSQHDKFRDNFPNGGQFGDRTTVNWFLEARKLVDDGQLIVPQGYYFVLGDNRDDSYDSRYWGLVPAENIVGRPLIIYWSMPRSQHADDGVARSDRLSTLAYSLVQSFKGLRWDRMFHVPHSVADKDNRRHMARTTLPAAKKPVAEEVADKPAKPQKQKETTPEFIASIAVVLVTGLFIITFILQAFEIPSSSMENTLLIGDHVFVNRALFAPVTKWVSSLMKYRNPKHGDIIVFVSPAEPGLYVVKRVMGTPGDRIHLQNGAVYRNGQKLDEPYVIRQGDYNTYRDNFPEIPPSPYDQLIPEWRLTLPSHIENGELVVPPDSIFAMGDNRDVSLDSRFWGFVPRENVIGTPMFNYWSFETPRGEYLRTSLTDRIGFFFRIVIHFFDQTRWNRMLHVVH